MNNSAPRGYCYSADENIPGRCPICNGAWEYAFEKFRYGWWRCQRPGCYHHDHPLAGLILIDAAHPLQLALVGQGEP